MKLAPLLSQYLFTNKRLDLPGIGTFLIENPETSTDEIKKDTSAEGISFKNNSSIKESPDLINFISSETGKMKALAMGDLDSHLEQARQFLNIGKPFLFEGIGSLVKIKSGEYAFTSGEMIPEKMKEYSVREISSTSSTEETFTHFYPKEKKRWRKSVFFLFIFLGIGLAVLGGYIVFKKTTATNNSSTRPVEIEKPKEQAVMLVDTSKLITHDSNVVQSASPATASGYKFVVEVADRLRGPQRYATLKGWGLDIKMETMDSLNYNLYFLLPATVSDTARIIDSLKFLYTPTWGKAFVEN